MPKLTDGFFNIPVKIYDRKEVQKMTLQMRDNAFNASEFDDITEPSWAMGFMRVPFTEIKAWHDDTSDEKSVEKIAQDGHNSTFVITHTCGSFECLWNKKRFEEELNKRYEEFEATLPPEEQFLGGRVK